MSPQIQINNISNLNLINQNMKKKLNHEAYQAYYNTSNTGGGAQLNIQSSPIGNQPAPGQGPSSINTKAANAPTGLLTNANIYGQNV